LVYPFTTRTLEAACQDNATPRHNILTPVAIALPLAGTSISHHSCPAVPTTHSRPTSNPHVYTCGGAQAAGLQHLLPQAAGPVCSNRIDTRQAALGSCSLPWDMKPASGQGLKPSPSRSRSPEGLKPGPSRPVNHSCQLSSREGHGLAPS